MADSGRVLGDCRHGRTPDWCLDCLRAENELLRGQVEWLTGENEGLRKGFEPALELARLENERLRAALQRIIRAWDAEQPEGGEWAVPAAIEDARKLLDGEG